jgi:hypothetical protein
MLPTVFSRTRGWISLCESTVVCARRRLEALAHQSDEFAELGRLHGDACGAQHRASARTIWSSK